MYFGFEDITIAFRSKTVLQHVTLDIPRGKIVTIIGQNGCGKSSTLPRCWRGTLPFLRRCIPRRQILTCARWYPTADIHT